METWAPICTLERKYRDLTCILKTLDIYCVLRVCSSVPERSSIEQRVSLLGPAGVLAHLTSVLVTNKICIRVNLPVDFFFYVFHFCLPLF